MGGEEKHCLVVPDGRADIAMLIYCEMAGQPQIIYWEGRSCLQLPDCQASSKGVELWTNIRKKR